MDLELTNVVNISVSTAQAGAGNYNTSNVGLFTREEAGAGFGDLGYKLYLAPSEVATDFGSSSTTYKMANALFSQQPNILAGGGYLAVIPMQDTVDAVVEIQHLSFSVDPTTGTYKLKYGANSTTALAAGASNTTIQTALRLLSGLGSVTVTGSEAAGFVITFTGVVGPASLLEVTENSLQGASNIDSVPTVTVATAGVDPATAETIGAAITRTKDLVQYFGILVAEITTSTPLLAAAAIVQPLNKIAGWVSRTAADVAPGGLLDQLRTGNYKKSRGLYYNNAASDVDALVFSAAYFGRFLSTNFSGSNTTQTLHLKDMIGIQPDSSISQTLLSQCQAAGVDVYVSLQGIPKLFTSGANGFADDVYNQEWIVGAMQVALFNALATSSTKLAQTEEGVSVLKGAIRTVCEQAVSNQYVAPGSWTSPTTFGNLPDFLRNISERGYYIYSAPVALQLAADRALRKAPLIQIAIKEAGAIHSASAVIYINQ